MNSKLFEKWLEEELSPRFENPSLIFMENAIFLNTIHDTMKKVTTQRLYQTSGKRSRGPGKRSFRKRVIRENDRESNLGYAVDEIIVNMGLQVLIFQLYHCIFNAIELIWAQCKIHPVLISTLGDMVYYFTFIEGSLWFISNKL